MTSSFYLGVMVRKILGLFLTFMKEEVKMEIKFATFDLHFKNRRNVIKHNGKEYEKKCIYKIHKTESLCYTPETNTTL